MCNLNLKKTPLLQTHTFTVKCKQSYTQSYIHKTHFTNLVKKQWNYDLKCRMKMPSNCV